MGRGMKNSGESTPTITSASESLHYVTITVLYGFRMHRKEAACFGIPQKTGKQLWMNWWHHLLQLINLLKDFAFVHWYITLCGHLFLLLFPLLRLPRAQRSIKLAAVLFVSFISDCFLPSFQLVRTRVTSNIEERILHRVQLQSFDLLCSSYAVWHGN